MLYLMKKYPLKINRRAIRTVTLKALCAPVLYKFCLVLNDPFF